MKVTAVGRLAGIRVTLSNEVLIRLRNIPGIKKWSGSMLLFEPSREAIAYVKSQFPKAEWDESAEHFVTVVESVAGSAIKLPPSVPKDFLYKTKPYDHQDMIFHRSRELAEFALLMDQGTGKTKIILDTAAYLWSRGLIRGLLVVAYPNGVHQNWVAEEIPAHLPDWCPRIAIAWNASKGEKILKPLYETRVGGDDYELRILAVNVEALSTKKGEEMCRKFLMTFPCLFSIDESSSVRKPSAKRTKSIVRLGSYAPYRRIMTGTATPNGPLNLYSQFQFLNEDILGFNSFYSFRNRYAVMRPLPGKFARNGRNIEVVVGYQHTDELQEKIKPHSYRVMKADCLDLPPKIYGPRLMVEMTDEQKRIYKEFVDNTVVEFQGRTISAALAINRMVRCHQVVCGFMPDEPGVEDSMGVAIDTVNPRLTTLMDYLETAIAFDSDSKRFETNTKAIIWATYRFSIREIMQALEDKYGKGAAIPYSGKTPQTMRPDIVKTFQDVTSRCKFLVANRAAAFGLTLTAATESIYYCNSFDLEVRLQSEDRPHRIGQHNPVKYTDVECKGTIDSAIIKKLRTKYEVSAAIMGDKVLDWLHGGQQVLDFVAE